MTLPRLALMLLVLAALLCLGTCAPSASSSSPSSAPQSYYDLLELSKAEARDAPLLKRKYRRLALQVHPDKATSDEERAAKQEMFVQLARAFEVLSKPRMRTRYDYLLSLGVFEYDDSRDWGDFDASQGFKRKPKSKEQKEREFKFKQAQELFEKAQDEAEERALWISLSLAGFIAALPALYMFIQRKRNAAAEVGQRKAKAAELRSNQAILMEMQAEQERERKQAEAEERAYAKQLRADREAAAAAAAAEKADRAPADGAAASSGEWEVVDESSQAEGEGAAAEDESSEEEAAPRAKTIVKCALCKKTFKSQAMMTQHEQSALHQKALKAAERAKKKSRRDE